MEEKEQEQQTENSVEQELENINEQIPVTDKNEVQEEQPKEETKEEQIVEEKPNKGSGKKDKIIITLLVIIILGLCGYFVYDKVINKEKTEDDNEIEDIEEIESNGNLIKILNIDPKEYENIDKVVKLQNYYVLQLNKNSNSKTIKIFDKKSNILFEEKDVSSCKIYDDNFFIEKNSGTKRYIISDGKIKEDENYNELKKRYNTNNYIERYIGGDLYQIITKDYQNEIIYNAKEKTEIHQGAKLNLFSLTGSEKAHCVIKDDKMGVINNKGELIVDYKYDLASGYFTFRALSDTAFIFINYTNINEYLNIKTNKTIKNVRLVRKNTGEESITYLATAEEDGDEKVVTVYDIEGNQIDNIRAKNMQINDSSTFFENTFVDDEILEVILYNDNEIIYVNTEGKLIKKNFEGKKVCHLTYESLTCGFYKHNITFDMNKKAYTLYKDNVEFGKYRDAEQIGKYLIVSADTSTGYIIYDENLNIKTDFQLMKPNKSYRLQKKSYIQNDKIINIIEDENNTTEINVKVDTNKYSIIDVIDNDHIIIKDKKTQNEKIINVKGEEIIKEYKNIRRRNNILIVETTSGNIELYTENYELINLNKKLLVDIYDIYNVPKDTTEKKETYFLGEDGIYMLK